MSGAMWREQSRVGVNRGTGAEQIARAAFVQILQNLETQCELQELDWVARDQDWAVMVGIPYTRTRLKRVAKSSMYLGAQPSLVSGEDARFDKWPAITVRCGPREPAAVRDQPDQYDILAITLIVEVLAVAGPFQTDPLNDRATSDQVDRQYQRLGDAVIACINIDRSLGNNIEALQLPPRAMPSLPWIRHVSKGSGSFAVFQGIELTWGVTSLMF